MNASIKPFQIRLVNYPQATYAEPMEVDDPDAPGLRRNVGPGLYEPDKGPAREAASMIRNLLRHLGLSAQTPGQVAPVDPEKLERQRDREAMLLEIEREKQRDEMPKLLQHRIELQAKIAAIELKIIEAKAKADFWRGEFERIQEHPLTAKQEKNFAAQIAAESAVL